MHTDPQHDRQAAARDVVWFTERGLRAMDDLATVLVHQMAQTPDGIARVLAHVMHAPVADLAEAMTAVADELRHLPRQGAATTRAVGERS